MPPRARGASLKMGTPRAGLCIAKRGVPPRARGASRFEHTPTDPGDQARAATHPPTRTGGTRRRDEPRRRDLRALLEGDHVLLDRAANDLPARVRAGLRLASAPHSGPEVRAVRGDRRRGHRRAVLLRLPGHVQHVHPLAVPAHLRRDPRRTSGRRGAGNRGDAVDLDQGRRVRDGAAAGGDRFRAGTERGDAAGAVHRLRHRLRLRRDSA